MDELGQSRPVCNCRSFSFCFCFSFGFSFSFSFGFGFSFVKQTKSWKVLAEMRKWEEHQQQQFIIFFFFLPSSASLQSFRLCPIMWLIDVVSRLLRIIHPVANGGAIHHHHHWNGVWVICRCGLSSSSSDEEFFARVYIDSRELLHRLVNNSEQVAALKPQWKETNEKLTSKMSFTSINKPPFRASLHTNMKTIPKTLRDI